MHTSRLPAAAAALAACLLVPSLGGAEERQPPTAPPTPPPASPPPAAGAAGVDADAERKALEEQIRREMGRSSEPRAPEARIAAQGASPAAAGLGGNPLARLMLLPDVSAIATATAGWDDATNTPRFAFEELELGLQSVVDPYLRADVFVAFAGEGVDVEEAFVTTLGLPLGLQLRAGKLFAPFGRSNQQHPHVREFPSAPLAQRLLAEEAFGGPGIALSWLAPLPWFAELHVAAQDTAPFAGDEGRLTGTARLLQYVSLGQAATLGVGLSAARRSEGRTAHDAPTPRAQFRDVGGADVYLRVRPPVSRSYLTVTGELYARRLVGLEGVAEGFDRGWWAQAFGRIGPYLGVGARFERAPSEAADGSDERLGGLVAWLPSEFQRLRLEVSRDRLAGGETGVSALLALEFGIGAHGAHPF